MSVAIRTERCEDCGHQVPTYDTIHLTLSAKQSRICTRCFNALIAKRVGVDFEHPNFAPIVLEDAAGTTHEFHFRTRHGGDHVAVEAFEIADHQAGGYEFQVLGDPSDDPIRIFQQLFERMRRALGRKHIEENEHGPQIAKSAEGWVVRGQIEWDDEEQGRVPRLVIDGKGYSWEQIGRMLMSFEGFRLKMETYDRSEER
ncbi:MAG: hypothetical protein E6J69_19460 [Deltaproteobacteria bacterium]|nr:MAG: hypothetical protein E6J69_19460 [Deltaproteobacteria bacterium]